MAYENYGDTLKNYARDKVADELARKVAKPVSDELIKYSDAASEAKISEFVSDGTKLAFDVATGEKSFDEATTYAKNYARDKVADEVARKVAKPVSDELVRYSDAAHESAYRVTYEIAEVSLPPKLSREVERQLRISANEIKRRNADNLEAATVEIVTSSTKTIFDAATGEKSFDEAQREIFSRTKVTVKNVVIERGKQVALDEAQRLGNEFVGQALQKIPLPAGVNANTAVEMLVLGNKLKDNILQLLDGQITLDEYIFQVNRQCLALAIKLVEKNSLKLGQGMIPIPVVGALIGSAVVSVACRGLMIAADAVLTKMEDGVRLAKKFTKDAWNARNNQAAADRRNVISKIKTDALAEMNRQRSVMQKCFADEKLTWDKNIQAGFELIASGTYSNDVEVIAQGLDKILQNFGSKAAFSSYEEFDDFFMDDEAVFKL